MKKFLKLICGVFTITLVLFEIILGIFNISSDYPNRNEIKDLIVYKPYSEGYFARGGFAEIKSKYRINNIGFNSLINYDFHQMGNKIGLVGDSFIEGFHCDVYNSIGRNLDNLLSNQNTVYEFGISGLNVHDYLLLYNKYNMRKFKYVFVFIKKEDFIGKTPHFQKIKETNENRSLLMRAYNYFNIPRYIRRNMGWTNNEPLTTINSQLELNKLDLNILKKFGDNTIFVTDEIFVRNNLNSGDIKLKFLSLTKKMDYGFDGHWNCNGRKFIANELASIIK